MSTPPTTTPDHTRSPQPPQTLRARYAALRQRRWFRWGMELSLMLAILLGVTAFQTRSLIKDSAPAPSFTLKDMEGRTHTLSQYQGKKTMLLFWAPWCTVCHAESHNIKAIKAAYKDKIHVVSVALAYEGDRAQVEGFIKKHDVDYTVLLGHTQTQRDYQVSAFPTLYILDERGHIEDSLVGYTTELGMRLRLWL